MTHTTINYLDTTGLAVIDLTTGTVLGDNLVAVDLSDCSEEEQEEISASDIAAFDYGRAFGYRLLVAKRSASLEYHLENLAASQTHAEFVENTHNVLGVLGISLSDGEDA